MNRPFDYALNVLSDLDRAIDAKDFTALNHLLGRVVKHPRFIRSVEAMTPECEGYTLARIDAGWSLFRSLKAQMEAKLRAQYGAEW